ncbi:MAG: DUF2306 domain-containing protein [Proteobacteria bacterium]|nr:DUF2306 domain-containing protein [Pseudomonadota bacterium]
MTATFAGSRSLPLKTIAFVLLAAAGVFVISQRDLQLLDANSALRHHYAGIGWLIAVHGIFGALALLIGPFQFSSRLRQRHTKIHRLMGKLYILGVVVAAPVSIPMTIILGPPELVMASVFQSAGWFLTTGTALYCIRSGRIAQHREWMMRSYPFAVVFIVTRVFLVLPPIEKLGLLGLDSVVWTTIALAAFLPSFLIALNASLKAKPMARSQVPGA